jgi:hypothetical protein
VTHPDGSTFVYLEFEGLRESRTIVDRLTRVRVTLPLAEAARLRALLLSASRGPSSQPGYCDTELTLMGRSASWFSSANSPRAQERPKSTFGDCPRYAGICLNLGGASDTRIAARMQRHLERLAWMPSTPHLHTTAGRSAARPRMTSRTDLAGARRYAHLSRSLSASSRAC